MWKHFGRYTSTDHNSAIASLLKAKRLFSSSGKARINDTVSLCEPRSPPRAGEETGAVTRAILAGPLAARTDPPMRARHRAESVSLLRPVAAGASWLIRFKKQAGARNGFIYGRQWGGNPFDRNQVTRISLKPEDVDAIVFWNWRGTLVP